MSTRLLHLVGRDETPFREIADVIQLDPALSAELLRLANSALFGARYPVKTISHAIALVGQERICNLIWTSFLSGFMCLVPAHETLGQCWRHSLASALCCERLAEGAGVNRRFAYTAGLLHDIGRLSLLASYPAEYARMLEVAAEYDVNVLSFERQVFRMDHCQAGAWLASYWAFPKEFSYFVAMHHTPVEDGCRDMMAVVKLGCQLADVLGFGVPVSRGAPDVGRLRSEFPDWAAGVFQNHTVEDLATEINLLDVALRHHHTTTASCV